MTSKLHGADIMTLFEKAIERLCASHSEELHNNEILDNRHRFATSFLLDENFVLRRTTALLVGRQLV